MNITFLVGNGFDINLGLKTKYEDFYKWYGKQGSENEDVIHLKDNIEENKENWSDLEIALGGFTEEFTAFEGYLNCHTDISEKLMEYLIEEEKKFNIENISEEQLNNMRKALSYFYKGLRYDDYNQFHSLLDQAIKNQTSYINFISFNYTSTLDKIVKKISEKHLKIIELSNINKHFLWVKANVIHVHDSLNGYPLLGVNDESQVKNKAFFENQYFRSLIIKEEAVKTKRINWHENAENMIKNSNIICIYGMSLGETDYKWWKLIKDWLIKSESRYLIIYIKEKKKELNINHPAVEQMKIDKGKDLFFRHFKDIEQSQLDKIKERVFVIFNSENILNVQIEQEHQIITTEEQTEEQIEKQTEEVTV